MKQAEFVSESYRRLRERFGDVECPLDYEKPFQLCIAVILSAQCTDAQVNRVTPALFKRFPEPELLANASSTEVEELIHSTGFYKNKTKSIQGFCRSLVESHNGIVPDKMEELLKMPGVGRKTANVILQEIYSIPSGIVVDTHVSRLARLFKLTKQTDPEKIEAELKKKIAPEHWMDWSLYMIFLGRAECTAKKRFCEKCTLSDICPSSSAG